jgi:hypothetical protein
MNSKEAIDAGYQKKKVDTLLGQGGKIIHVFSVTQSILVELPSGVVMRVSPWGKCERDREYEVEK